MATTTINQPFVSKFNLRDRVVNIDPTSPRHLMTAIVMGITPTSRDPYTVMYEHEGGIGQGRDEHYMLYKDYIALKRDSEEWPDNSYGISIGF